MPNQCDRSIPAPGTQPIYEIDALTFRFPDGHPALQGIDLTIYEGDRIALVGPNGAGKTTLVKHLVGLYRAPSGAVRYKGRPIEGNHLAQTRLQVGMLFQDPDDQLFSNTLYDDVAFGPLNQGADKEEVHLRTRRALAEVGLLDCAFKAPHHLSYGQKKRAALATVLAMNPGVLILDEPTANLDPKQEKIFFELLARFSGTLICISHDLPFLYRLCLRAVVMSAGRIRHDLPMKELLSHRHSLRDHGLDFTFRLGCCGGRDGGPHAHHHHAEGPAEGAHSGASAAPEAVPHRDASPLIRLEDYSYRYPDGTRGFRNVSLTVGKGERLALIGENGAGKSTLVGCLMGIRAGTGRYTFDGTPVDGRVRKDLWRRVGMVFQDPADQLFCPSCREEVAFGPRQLRLSPAEIDRRVVETMRQVQLEGFDNRVPHHLSAGERKRLAIAAALSMRPEVLILDEPTANLDPQSEELILEILRRLQVTLILITHDPFFITTLCQRALVMHHGSVIRDYPTEDFERDVHLVEENGLDYHFKDGCCREIARLQEGTA